MASSDLKCPACGERVFASDQQCLSCGARLDEGRIAGSAYPSDERATTTEVKYDTGAAAQTGWAPSSLGAGSGGFMASISRGWLFLKQAVGMAFKDKDLILPSVLSLLANLVVLGILIGVLHLTGNLEVILKSEGERHIGPVAWIILLGFGFIGWVITYFFTGMTVHLVDVHLKGRDAKMGAAFADCVRNIGGITMLAVVTMVVQLITGAMRGRNSGALSNMAANTAERAWTVATYLMLPIIIIEDVSFIDATSRATRLHGSNIMQIVVGELGLLITTRIFTGLTVLIAMGIAAGVYFLAPALMIVGFVVAAVMLLLAMTFAAYVRTAFYTCMYLWAAAIETVGETAPAPAPLQPAIQRAG